MTEPITRKVAILGAAGYTGKELLRILSAHHLFEVCHVTSDKHAGRTLEESFPELPKPRQNLIFTTHDASLPEGADVFLATPNEVSLARVPALLAAGHRVVDLSGAFRLHNLAEFKEFYKLDHNAPESLGRAVYGIPEIHRKRIQNAQLVANPGCFPTGVIFPLSVLEAHQEQILGVSIDAKSGVSGAGGRVEDGGFSYSSVYENFRAYKILSHQHWPEIREYSANGSLGERIVFTPHLLPLFRGILSTITIFWSTSPPDVQRIFESACASEPFVRLLGSPEDVQLSRVQHTNYIDVGLRSRGKTTVIVTAIDNLVKGAAGQAVQNLNLMNRIPETSGLV